jgi:hypothetical protein
MASDQAPIEFVTPNKRYTPVGYCIYCLASSNLTKEHIIPHGLAGDSLILRELKRPTDQLPFFQQPLYTIDVKTTLPVESLSQSSADSGELGFKYSISSYRIRPSSLNSRLGFSISGAPASGFLPCRSAGPICGAWCQVYDPHS